MTLAKANLEIERTARGFNISGLEYTVEEAMYISDWIVTKLQDENPTQEMIDAEIGAWEYQNKDRV
jgi:hypothetical protein